MSLIMKHTKANRIHSSGLENSLLWAGPWHETLLTLRHISLDSGFWMFFQVTVGHNYLFLACKNQHFPYTQITTESPRI